MSDPVNRSEKRFSACDGSTLSVGFRADGSQVPATAEVVDISPSGAKMHVSAPLRTDQRVVLQLKADDAGVDQQVAARVCWIRLGRGYHWLTGVRFESPLEVAELEKLAGAGYIEQRSTPRTDVLVPARARRETLAGDIDVQITNLSKTGFRVVSAEAMQPGERMLLGTESEEQSVSIPAHVRWSGGNEDDAFSVGCEFVDKDSFKHLKHHIPKPETETEPVAADRRGLRHRLCVAVIATAAATAIAVDSIGLSRLSQHAGQMWNSCMATVQSVTGIID